MLPLEFRLAEWIESNFSSAEHNLSSSGLSMPRLSEMGIETSFETFAKESENAFEDFTGAVAGLYGVSPENIIPTAGGTEGIFLVNALLQNRINRMFVPIPEYEPMFTVPLALGMETITDSFDHILSKVGDDDGIGFTNPNNPTGRQVDESILSELLNKARKFDTTLYIDETFREFRLPEKSDTLYDGSRNIITSNTMTKFYGIGGFRVGWIIASEENARELRRLKMLVSAGISQYSMWIASQILKHREKFVERVRKLTETNFKIARETFESIPGVEWSNPDSGLFGFVRYERGMDPLDLVQKAMESHKILLSPGDYFGEENSFRVCLTSEPEKLSEDLKVLAAFLKEELR